MKGKNSPPPFLNIVGFPPAPLALIRPLPPCPLDQDHHSHPDSTPGPCSTLLPPLPPPPSSPESSGSSRSSRDWKGRFPFSACPTPPPRTVVAAKGKLGEAGGVSRELGCWWGEGDGPHPGRGEGGSRTNLGLWGRGQMGCSH